ncbi:class I SAM-dependent methyltransferase [Streptomyces sp. NBC_01408]|uniref:class I SAM-dependent methyltransferase n=1 Tax=Streptomyces sp. NBC_01408 TaxID=2903855 RepID=UPI002252B27F|nr:class I SAM-dependent methyltransferase [Streptomyces sp. NBC_01408]MCX4692768.1 class I SAM-dependent methyltransferase [Streptomyces sp. NBC_01408]
MTDPPPGTRHWYEDVVRRDRTSLREPADGAVPYGEAVRLPTDADSVTDEEFHDSEAPVYDAYGETPRTEVSEAWLLDWVAQEVPDGITVDLGTGTGRVAERLAGPRRRVIAVDRSRKMLELARHKLPAAHAVALRADVRELPLEDASVDAVVCSGVLHHLPQWPAAVEEAARVLKPGGKLLVREPNEAYAGQLFEPFERLMELAARKLGGDRGDGGAAAPGASGPDASAEPEGLSPVERPISPDRLIEVGRSAGFRVDRTGSAMFFGSLGIPGDSPVQRLYFEPANLVDRFALRWTGHHRGALFLAVLTRTGLSRA